MIERYKILIEKLENQELDVQENTELVSILETSDDAFQYYMDNVELNVSLYNHFDIYSIYIDENKQCVKVKPLLFSNFIKYSKYVAAVAIFFALFTLLNFNNKQAPLLAKELKAEQILITVSNSKTKNADLAVFNALRWLKNNQNKGGFWPKDKKQKYKSVLTGLSLLCFLRYSDVSLIKSQEFNQTIQTAITWLKQDTLNFLKDKKVFPDTSYKIPILAYTISQAYSITGRKDLKTLMNMLTNHMLSFQQKSGGWDRLYLGDFAKPDIDITAWHLRALKSVELAGVHTLVLEKALKKGKKFLNSIMEKELKKYFPRNISKSKVVKNYAMPVFKLASLISLIDDTKDINNKDNFSFASSHLSIVNSIPDFVSTSWNDFKNDTSYKMLSNCYYYTKVLFNNNTKNAKNWRKMLHKELISNQNKKGYWTLLSKDVGSHSWDSYYSTILCSLMLEENIKNRG